ncbi:MAG: hypothetical protein KBI44_10570 [Thermoanaerobaculia bacterium]|jgi:hypothetical protein|nr:hypothetical protein [Thermoanaerobaculia bacterium]
MENRGLYERILQGKVREVGFDEFRALVEARGFRFERFEGDDWIFDHPSRPETLGVQARGGKIQAFQALFLLQMMETQDFASAG